jgi:acyl-coenzyme A synthetase/AMP-(fatty) acid ligase
MESTSAKLAQALGSAPAARAIAFGGTWRDRAWLTGYWQAADKALGSARRIGIVARNRPQHVAMLTWGIARRRHTVMIHAAQSPNALAREVVSLGLDAVCADPEDWSAELRKAAIEAGAAAIAISDAPAGINLIASGAPCERSEISGVAVSLLSSGTTGAPKHIPLTWATLDGIVGAAAATYAGSQNADAPIIMVHPLGNIAGIAYIVPAVARGQAVVLLEKFDALKWAEAVKRYRPARAAIPPVALRMVLDARIAPEDLASLKLLAIGGGKLAREVQDNFEATYAIPVLTAYGATEFGGVIAGWTLEDYRRDGQIKRGSAGRPSAGAEIRIVAPETGDALPAGEVGLLEARIARCGTDWIRTTDLASLDTDGYLYIHGRSDGAINRGGFKIVPDSLAAVLAGHPAIAEAVVVGIPDERLGEVPVAAVELAAGSREDSSELAAWLRDRVPAFHMPTEIRIVEALPRNASMKVRLDAVRSMFIDQHPG